jgi:hypothetical protein
MHTRSTWAAALLMMASLGCGDGGSAPSPDAGSGGGGGDASAGADSGTGTPGTPSAPGTPPAPRASASVLFSGHSLLDNPITDWVAAIAAAKGDTLGWEQQIVIGSPMRVRTRGNDSGAGSYPGYALGKNKNGQGRDMLSEIASPSALPSGARYDTLLITERHDPLNTLQWENSVGYLRHYHDRLAERSPDARTYFYQCWPDIDKGAPEAWISYQRTELTLWECIASKVNLSLASSGKPPNVRVIPGAVALAELVKSAYTGGVPGLGSGRAALDAIFTDDVHLGDAGAYLIAAVHYASIFGKSPVGAHATSELSADTADAVEKIAWSVVSSYADGSTRSMEACRKAVAEEVCPAYYAVRGQSVPGQGCSALAGSSSPLTFPDPALPLPAP